MYLKKKWKFYADIQEIMQHMLKRDIIYIMEVEIVSRLGLGKGNEADHCMEQFYEENWLTITKTLFIQPTVDCIH
ncbi:hypothetical protein E2320_019377 [Naja naja]|nr:hypothetical protein E2320_019377 [Naja naja]